MKIAVRQTGGYAGEIDLGTVDTAQLEPAARRQVEQMVQSTGFFEAQSSPPTGGVGADMARYEVTVTDDGRQHTVTFAERGGPEQAALRRLVDAVIQLPKA